MHFLTVVEAREWCRDWVELTDAGVPTRPSREQRFARGPTSDEVAFCRQVERALQPAADLVSYLQVGLLCGWDMHLLPAVGYARAFVSHDEYVEFTADKANASLVDEFAAELEGAQVMSREEPA